MNDLGGDQSLRRVLPVGTPRRWTLLSAMRVFGITPVIGRRKNGTKTTCLVRDGDRARLDRDYGRTHIPFAERFEGGPDYIFETARSAYRDASSRCHPDHGGSTEAMQTVNAAWAYVQRRWGPK